VSEALDELKAWADRLGRFLPGMGGPSTEDISRMSPDEYAQYQQDLVGARARAQPKMRRLVGNVAKSYQSVDPDTGEVKFFAQNPLKMTRPEIADELIAMPVWLGEALGYDMSNWPQSQQAMKNTETVEGAMREGLDYPPPSNPEEYALEAAGSMLGQLPVPEGSFSKLKAPFRAAGEAARTALGPVAGRAAQAATLVPRAGIEFFSPMVEPSLYNYAAGTGFGTGLSYLRDPNQDEFDALKWKLQHGEVDPDEAIQKLTEIMTRAGPASEPIHQAKGGKIRPPSLMELRKSIEGLFAKEAPQLEGSGKEMVPVTPPEQPSADLPAPTDITPTLDDLKQMAGEAGPSTPAAPEPQQITNFPVSRRAFLSGAAKGAASLLSPVKLDLGSLLDPVGSSLGLEKLGETAMTEKPGLMGVIARLNDTEGYERGAWGATTAESRRNLINHLAEGLDEGQSEFEDLDQIKSIVDEFGLRHTKGLDTELRDQFTDPFDNLMAYVRGHDFTSDEDMPHALEAALKDPAAIENDDKNLRDVRSVRRAMKRYAKEQGVPYADVESRVLEQTKREATNNLWWDPEGMETTPAVEQTWDEIKSHGGELKAAQDMSAEELRKAHPHLTPGEVLDLHGLIQSEPMSSITAGNPREIADRLGHIWETVSEGSQDSPENLLDAEKLAMETPGADHLHRLLHEGYLLEKDMGEKQYPLDSKEFADYEDRWHNLRQEVLETIHEVASLHNVVGVPGDEANMHGWVEPPHQNVAEAFDDIIKQAQNAPKKAPLNASHVPAIRNFVSHFGPSLDAAAADAYLPGGHTELPSFHDEDFLRSFGLPPEFMDALDETVGPLFSPHMEGELTGWHDVPNELKDKWHDFTERFRKFGYDPDMPGAEGMEEEGNKLIQQMYHGDEEKPSTINDVMENLHTYLYADHFAGLQDVDDALQTLKDWKPNTVSFDKYGKQAYKRLMDSVQNIHDLDSQLEAIDTKSKSKTSTKKRQTVYAKLEKAREDLLADMDDFGRDNDHVVSDDESGPRYVKMADLVGDPEKYFDAALNNAWDRPSAVAAYIHDAGLSEKFKDFDPLNDISMYKADKKELAILAKIFGGKKKIPKTLLESGWST
jgi:hypothetical protein